MADLACAVFDGLDRDGLSWALLRGRAELDAPGGDVDLLVREDHLASFEDVVFELGAFALPGLRLDRRRRPPWHRFYLLPDPASENPVKLDVVTRLVYSRQLGLASGLERGCLERRVRDGHVFVLDPSDYFWTVLLHCLLDKQKVKRSRAAELESLAERVERPTPGEEFFGSMCPPGVSPGDALAWVRRRDWDALVDLGHRILADRGEGRPALAERAEHAAGPRRAARPGSASARTAGPGARAAAALYPVVWRRAGLGAVPRVLDVVEAGRVDGTVLALRRRPALCEVLMLTPEAQHGRLCDLLRSEHYVAAAGRWNRLNGTGLESVRLVTPSQLGRAPQHADRVRRSSLPMAGRTHCRRAVETDGLPDGAVPRARSGPRARPVGGAGG